MTRSASLARLGCRLYGPGPQYLVVLNVTLQHPYRISIDMNRSLRAGPRGTSDRLEYAVVEPEEPWNRLGISTFFLCPVRCCNPKM